MSLPAELLPLVITTLLTAGQSKAPDKSPQESPRPTEQGKTEAILPAGMDQVKRLMEAAIAEGKADRRTPCLELMAQAEAALEAVPHKSTASYWEEVERLAIMYGEMSRPEAAIPLQQKILEHRRSTFGSDHLQVADALNQLGVSHIQSGGKAQAEAAWTEALTIREKLLGRHPLTADSLNNLGVLHRRDGRKGQAEHFLTSSRDMRKETLGANHPAYASSIMNLGGLYAETGRLLEADELFREALPILEKRLGPEALNIAKHLRSMALLNIQAGRLEEALPLLQRSLAIMEKRFKEDEEHGAACLAMGALQDRLGRPEEAVTWARKALELEERIRTPKHSSIAKALSNVGAYLLNLKRPEEALAALDRALAIFLSAGGPDHPDTLLCQYNRAEALDALGKLAEAGELFQKVLPAQEAIQGPESPRLAIHWTAYGKNLIKRGMTKEGVAAFQKAIALETRTRDTTLALLSDRERLAYSQPSTGRAEALHALLNLASDGQASPDEAAQAWVNWKGLALDAEDRVQASLAGPEQQERLKRLGNARRELGLLLLQGPTPSRMEAFRTQVAEARRRKEALEVELARESPAFRALQTGATITLTALKEQLPKDGLLVDFARIPKLAKATGQWESPHYLAIVLKGGVKETVEIQDLGPAEPIDAAIHSFRVEIERGGTKAGIRPKQMTSALGLLQSRLMTPLEPSLKGSRSVLLSPDGPLNLLPFEVLATTKVAALDRFKVHYLSAPRDLLRAFSAIHTQGGVDIFTHPDFEGELLDAKPGALRSGTAKSLQDLTFTPLPHSEKEGEAIRSLFIKRGETVRLHQGSEATEQALLACRSPRVLHLATHGFFLSSTSGFEDVPMLCSGLALSGANRSLKQHRDTGLLTADKLTSLKLQGTDLVVLSACETGVGRVVDGEGVLGLKRALMLSGARSLVLSLWKVPDEATRTLMVYFYRHLQAGRTKVEALRLAKLEVRKAHPNPLYWAAFILVGQAE